MFPKHLQGQLQTAQATVWGLGKPRLRSWNPGFSLIAPMNLHGMRCNMKGYLFVTKHERHEGMGEIGLKWLCLLWPWPDLMGSPLMIQADHFSAKYHELEARSQFWRNLKTLQEICGVWWFLNATTQENDGKYGCCFQWGGGFIELSMKFHLLSPIVSHWFVLGIWFTSTMYQPCTHHIHNK